MTEFNLPSVNILVDCDVEATILSTDISAISGFESTINCTMLASNFNKLGYVFRVTNDASGTDLYDGHNSSDIDVEVGRCVGIVNGPSGTTLGTRITDASFAAALIGPSKDDGGNISHTDFGEAQFSTDTTYGQNRFGRDILCQIAKNLFGTHHGVDLFTNEAALGAPSGDIEGAISTKFETAILASGKGDFLTAELITEANLSTPGTAQATYDVSNGNGWYQLSSSPASNNEGTVAKALLHKAFVSKHSMVMDLSGGGVEDAGWHTWGDYRIAKMDLNATDSLAFTITIDTANQNALNTNVAIDNRVYKVIITLT